MERYRCGEMRGYGDKYIKEKPKFWKWTKKVKCSECGIEAYTPYKDLCINCYQFLRKLKK